MCLALPQRWSHRRKSRGSFFGEQKVFRTNLLHPENIVRVRQQGPCLPTMHIFRRLSLLFIPGRRAFIFSPPLLFRYTHTHNTQNTPTSTEPPTIFVLFFIPEFVFFTSLLTMLSHFNGWMGCCSCSMHAHEFRFFSQKNNNSVNAERKKIETKNCAHIIFPEKTTDETESKAKRIKLISHFCCWSPSSQHSRRSVWMGDSTFLLSYSQTCFSDSKICLFSVCCWCVLRSCCRLHAESVNMRTLLRYGM